MGWWWVARDERNSGTRARPAWPPRRVTKDGHVLSGSFTGRYERARRALRAKRRAALLGFPLPAAQRVDARYEKTYRAAQRSHRAGNAGACAGPQVRRQQQRRARQSPRHLHRLAGEPCRSGASRFQPRAVGSSTRLKVPLPIIQAERRIRHAIQHALPSLGPRVLGKLGKAIKGGGSRQEILSD
jgi:hypothetical protein